LAQGVEGGWRNLNAEPAKTNVVGEKFVAGGIRDRGSERRRGNDEGKQKSQGKKRKLQNGSRRSNVHGKVHRRSRVKLEYEVKHFIGCSEMKIAL
jgi:hypothetical protein